MAHNCPLRNIANPGTPIGKDTPHAEGSLRGCDGSSVHAGVYDGAGVRSGGQAGGQRRASTRRTSSRGRRGHHVADDHRAEIVFDVRANRRDLAAYAGQISKGKFVYGSEVRLFRGSVITIQPTRGRTLYLDGELINLPTNILEIKISEKQLKVYR